MNRFEICICTVCIDGQFGDDCQYTCKCKDKSEVCIKSTGVCHVSGCASPGVTIESGCLEGSNYN